MPVTVSITEDKLTELVGNFLQSVLPSSVRVIVGQVNRVAQPLTPDHVVMTPTFRRRLSTNLDEYLDTRFIGSIAGNTLTVETLSYGSLTVGRTVFGVGVTPGTVVLAAAGPGAWTVNNSQAIASEVMAAGVMDALQATDVVIQLDVHGPAGGENSQIITTLFRDDYAVQAFKATGFDVAPLYTEDARQVPFINGESQYEDRWIVEVHLQANIVVEVPQQFAETVTVGLIDVDAVYPP